MIKVKLYLDTRSIKKDGSFPIKIYVGNNRKVFYINTGISTEEEIEKAGDVKNTEGTKDISSRVERRIKITKLKKQLSYWKSVETEYDKKIFQHKK